MTNGISLITIQRKHIDPVFSVMTDSNYICHILMLLFEPFSTSGNKLSGFIINAMTVADRIQLEYEDVKITLTKEQTIQQIINIIYKSSQASRGYTLLHAAAVALGDTAYIFIGHTQSGKSTLTAYLCANGFEYLTDDITIVENSTCRVLPYRKNIMLREGSLDILANANIIIDRSREIKWNGNSRYPYIPNITVRYKSYKPGGIFYIRRNENQINKATALDSSEAFIKLLASGLYHKKTTSEHLHMIKELSGTGCYNLDYSSMKYVKEVLRGGDLTE